MLDLSSELVELRSELHRVLTQPDSTSSAVAASADTAPLRSTEALCQADVERIIVDCVTAHRYAKALQCVRYYG